MRVTRNGTPVGVMLSMEQFAQLRNCVGPVGCRDGRHEPGGSRQGPDASGVGVAALP